MYTVLIMIFIDKYAGQWHMTLLVMFLSARRWGQGAIAMPASAVLGPLAVGLRSWSSCKCEGFKQRGDRKPCLQDHTPVKELRSGKRDPRAGRCMMHLSRAEAKLQRACPCVQEKEELEGKLVEASPRSRDPVQGAGCADLTQGGRRALDHNVVFIESLSHV